MSTNDDSERIRKVYNLDQHNTDQPHERIMLALMSGTSVDTIDAAICRVWQNDDKKLGCEVLSFYEHEMSGELRERIFEVFRDGAGSLSLTCSLNFEIGQAFAHAAMGAAMAWGTDIHKIDAIASHGQTLYHIAPHMVADLQDASDARVPSTLQVGEPAVIAALTGRPVINNFRVADMAVGGNGAPLVPFADYHLFSQPGRGVVVHNLGGIANCTWLPANGIADEVLAFDTGPANMIIDALVSKYYPGESCDNDGKYASSGTVVDSLLAKWMAIPFISAPPPKSTGRELFGVQFAESAIAENHDVKPQDLIATATEFTAQSLAVNLRDHIAPQGTIDQLILAGGGARNSYLVKRIAAAVAPGVSVVSTLDDIGHSVTSKSRECAGFALLGFAHLYHIPANLPSVTGAQAPTILGQFTPAP